jgi:hypothetical protein
MRKKVTEQGKRGTAFNVGGQKLHTDKQIEGSMPKRGAKARTESEKARDVFASAAACEASTACAEARGKGAVCESDGVIFNKNKRNSFMPESRKMNVDKASCSAMSKDCEGTRKMISSRDHTSSVFSSGAAPEHRPSRVCNIKHEAKTLPSSTINESTAKTYKAMNDQTDVSQMERANNRRHNNTSTIFNSNSENMGGNISRPTTASSQKTASNIFGGGAFADDAAKSRPTSAASRRPINISQAVAAGSGGGGLASARDTAQAALRGSGSLW